jgi:hypothetical protein
VFIVHDFGNLRRMRRSPSNRDTLEMRGWRFLPENRKWKMDERDAVIAAITDLYAVSGMLGTASDKWIKRRALEFCQHRAITLTADPD